MSAASRSGNHLTKRPVTNTNRPPAKFQRGRQTVDGLIACRLHAQGATMSSNAPTTRPRAHQTWLIGIALSLAAFSMMGAASRPVEAPSPSLVAQADDVDPSVTNDGLVPLEVLPGEVDEETSEGSSSSSEEAQTDSVFGHTDTLGDAGDVFGQTHTLGGE
jgi:hypothetical protein